MCWSKAIITETNYKLLLVTPAATRRKPAQLWVGIYPFALQLRIEICHCAGCWTFM